MCDTTILVDNGQNYFKNLTICMPYFLIQNTIDE